MGLTAGTMAAAPFIPAMKSASAVTTPTPAPTPKPTPTPVPTPIATMKCVSCLLDDKITDAITINNGNAFCKDCFNGRSAGERSF